MTVAEVFDEYTIFKQDTSDVSQSNFLQWCNTVNRSAYRLMVGIDPNRFVLSTSYTTVNSSDPSTQALPTDFKNMQPWNTGFFLTDNNGNIINQRLILTSPSAQLWGYYLDGTNVVFTSPQDRSYILRYVAKLDSLTSFADSLCIPDEYLDYVLKAVDVLYSQWDEDYTAEGIDDQRYVRVMQEFAEDISNTPLAFDLIDYSGTFTNDGSAFGFGFGVTWY